MEVPTSLAGVAESAESAIAFVVEHPLLRFAQASILLLAVVLIFLVFFTTRDILLRSQSFLLQVACILLVALLPVLGFLLYLLIRPVRTLRERSLEASVLKVQTLLEVLEHDRLEGEERKPPATPPKLKAKS